MIRIKTFMDNKKKLRIYVVMPLGGSFMWFCLRQFGDETFFIIEYCFLCFAVIVIDLGFPGEGL